MVGTLKSARGVSFSMLRFILHVANYKDEKSKDY